VARIAKSADSSSMTQAVVDAWTKKN